LTARLSINLDLLYDTSMTTDYEVRVGEWGNLLVGVCSRLRPGKSRVRNGPLAVQRSVTLRAGGCIDFSVEAFWLTRIGQSDRSSEAGSLTRVGLSNRFEL
jgi:hypothetical protein